MRRSVVVVAVLAVVMLTLALTLGPSPTPSVAQGSPLPIRIGYQAVASWVLFGARDLKLYEKAGLTPTFLKFTAGAPMIAAAQSKSIDVAMVGTVPFLAGVAQGVDWIYIGLDNEYPRAVGFVVRKDGGIGSLADLNGKTIGFFRGSTSHYAVLTVLKRQGIATGQVKLLHLEPAQQVAAMMNRQIDVAATWEPWMQKMVHQADGKILVREADIGLYTGLGVYAVRRDWLQANRETARRFLEGLLLGYDALEKNPTPALKAVEQEMGIPEPWAMAIFKEAGLPAIYKQTDPGYRYSLAKDGTLQTSLADLARFLLEEKVITRPVDVGTVVDASVMTEALAAHQRPK
ncbi:MAG TPA: ABC transporter substrate-binding protein [Candidatus Methylomirabilis sp.]|nr:ABC transporter substrate-binding protein [Candidatus Methylomirabilis sp.]